MKLSLVKIVARLLRETADKLEAGNSELTQSEAMDIASVLCHEALSKAQACKYLNLERSHFDDYVRNGMIPRGRKILGYKELRWYRDELDESKRKIKIDKYGNS
jgi:predicted DNA-binding transcriptional regulator AlpA